MTACPYEIDPIVKEIRDRPDAGNGNDVIITHASVMTSYDDIMRSVVVKPVC